jgi:iron complex outermembrane recepter protein
MRLPLPSSALLLLNAALLAAETGVPRGTLADASMEDLLAITVATVNKRDETVFRTAAAAHVITAEEIRRSGATNIPEALRLAPGVQVSQFDAFNYAVGIRGFNQRFSNKIVILIDGRNAYQQVYGGVLWGLVDLPMDDIERIEVIRGPGVTMWGVNAVNGVVNVITRHSRTSQGQQLSLIRGGDMPGQLVYRYGLGRGDKLFGRIWAKDEAATPSKAPNALIGSDRLRRQRIGYRLDWEANESNSLRIDGDVYNADYRFGAELRSLTVPGQQTQFPGEGHGHGGSLMGRWRHVHRDGSESAVIAWTSLVRQTELGQRIYLQASEAEWNYRRSIGKQHTLFGGGGISAFRDQLEVSLFKFPAEMNRSQIYSGFLQDRWELFGGKVQLEGGIRVLHHFYTGAAWQPRMSMLYSPNRHHSFWLSKARAIRTPSRIDYAADLPRTIQQSTAPGGLNVQALLRRRSPENGMLEPETLRALEGGWRYQLSKKVSSDLAVFRNSYSDLFGYKLAGISRCPYQNVSNCLYMTLDLVNGIQASNWGWEIATQYRAADRLQMNFAWSRLRVGSQVSEGLVVLPGTQTAAWMDQTQLAIRTKPLRRWEMDGQWFFNSRQPASSVPRWNRIDLQASRSLGEGWRLSAGVRNLLDSNHAETFTADYVLVQLRKRALWSRLEFRF